MPDVKISDATTIAYNPAALIPVAFGDLTPKNMRADSLAGTGVVFSTTVLVTSAELLNLSSVEVEILPPPGAGLQYNYVSAFYSYRFGTSPYNGDQSSNPQLFCGPLANNVAFDNYGLTALLEFTANGNASGIGGTAQEWLTDTVVFGQGPTENQGIYLGVQTGDLLSGDGTLLITVLYNIVTV